MWILFLIARTSPNLPDLGIALAAGTYGQIRRQAGDALIGVAVAVALVPPPAVVGITLQLAEFRMALGATFLFLANVTGIVLSARTHAAARGSRSVDIESHCGPTQGLCVLQGTHPRSEP